MSYWRQRIGRLGVGYTWRFNIGLIRNKDVTADLITQKFERPAVSFCPHMHSHDAMLAEAILTYHQKWPLDSSGRDRVKYHCLTCATCSTKSEMYIRRESKKTRGEPNLLQISVSVARRFGSVLSANDPNWLVQTV